MGTWHCLSPGAAAALAEEAHQLVGAVLGLEVLQDFEEGDASPGVKEGRGPVGQGGDRLAVALARVGDTDVTGVRDGQRLQIGDERILVVEMEYHLHCHGCRSSLWAGCRFA